MSEIVASPGLSTQVQSAAYNHPTTAASGTSGALGIVILSLLIHCNIHPTIEESMAWQTLMTSFFGWLLRFASKRWPVLDLNPSTVATASNGNVTISSSDSPNASTVSTVKENGK